MGILKKLLLVIFLMALLLFGIVFSMENNTEVPLDLLIVQLPQLRVSLWLVSAFIVGGLCGLIIAALKLLQLKTQYQVACRKLAKAEKELNQLKSGSARS